MPDAADIRREFALLAAREPVPMARGALLIAQEEYPALDLEKYMDKLAAIAREAELVVRMGNDTIEKIQLLSHFLFEQKGFEGNRDDYTDPRNSFLNEVIDRRRGIPISLSVLYIEIGRRVGLNLHGIGFPTHFLVKAVDERGELIIDPFYDGAILTLEEIRARLQVIYGQPVEVSPAHLKPIGARQILIRMLRNLKNVYLKKIDSTRALSALDRILLLDPRSLDELMERGALYESMECFKAALDDFQSFLSQAPDHTGAETAREAVLRLARQVELIN
ncbi:MAG TPA: tetratricopeptide repeat protein [Candidatus Binataceae bacterium]|nr:tetratricopeptide repeat protein [Candidatus Binataceae bacterium]